MMLATSARATPTETFRERRWQTLQRARVTARVPGKRPGYNWVSPRLQQGCAAGMPKLAVRAPRTLMVGTADIPANDTNTPCTLAARRRGTWASVVPRPPPAELRSAALLPPTMEVCSARDCCWWCSAHQAVARGTRGVGTPMIWPRGGNRHACSAPGSRNCSNNIVLDLPDDEMDRANANHHVRLSVALAVLNVSDLLCGNKRR